MVNQMSISAVVLTIFSSETFDKHSLGAYSILLGVQCSIYPNGNRTNRISFIKSRTDIINTIK